MEPAEIRPESPVLACVRAGDEESDIIPKKKSQRIKQKIMEKEIANGNDAVTVEVQEDSIENNHIVCGEANGFENGHHQPPYEYPFDKSTQEPTENGTSVEPSNCDDVTENNLNFEESTTGSDGTIPVIVDGDTEEEDPDDKENRNGTQPETEASADSVTNPPESSNAEEEPQKNDDENEGEDKTKVELNGMATPVNGQESKEFDQVQVSGIPVNGSDEESFYETVEMAKEVEESPDTTTQPADNSFTHRISSFLGKWQTSSPVRDEKQEPVDASSSKRGENASKPTVPHPYLSKVTGRRGIKMKANLNGVESETPKNKGPALSDSFRVKTDPPRLSQADTGLESVLRKYKGKRCLNVNDEDDDDEEEENGCENERELYPKSNKRRKLEEKGSGSGFLGNMLWSPFKKKPDEKAVAQSKLSRFLSPFWFWKKTVTDHERN